MPALNATFSLFKHIWAGAHPVYPFVTLAPGTSAISMAFVPCAALCGSTQFRRRSGLQGKTVRTAAARVRRRAILRCAAESGSGTETEKSVPGSAPEAVAAGVPKVAGDTVGREAPAGTAPEATPVASEAAPAAAANTPTAAVGGAGGDEDSAGKVPFEIRGFSLANVGLLAGVLITVVSFSSYFGSNGTASATSLGFVYGVPVLLVGCALKYAELEPVPLQTTASAVALREASANATQKKIISDITRHRYGDEAHLSAALAALGLVAKGLPCPQLVAAAEFATKGGRYCLALNFVSANVPYSAWEERTERYERFFGPGVAAETEKLDEENRIVQVRLIANA